MFYNGTKGGVDTFDQLCAKTTCARKTPRWPLCFFYGMLDMVYTNSYILYTLQHKDTKMLTRRNYGMALATELCRPWAIKRLSLKNISRELRVLIGSVHQVAPEAPTDDMAPAGEGNGNRCHICSRKKNHKSTFYCNTCTKNVCKKHFNINCRNCLI